MTEQAECAEREEMRGMLRTHGYEPDDVDLLTVDGVGPFELEHRLTSCPGVGWGSVTWTHGVRPIQPANASTAG